MSNGQLNNLFIAYTGGDTDVRPITAGSDVWESPDLGLEPIGPTGDPSHYGPNGTAQTINVVVSLKPDVPTYAAINVEVWVCNPSTAPAPNNALAPSSTAAPGTALTGGSPPTGARTKIPVTGFVPYQTMRDTNGGHVCLIANCFGITTTGLTDGQSLQGTATPLFSLLYSDGHVAMHNIFAAPVGMRQGRLSFPFEATTSILRGTEDAVLEIQNVTGAAALGPDDLSYLHNGPFRNLPLHVSTIPVRNFVLDGCEGGPTKCVTLRLDAGHAVPLRIEVDFEAGETIGGIHTFDVIQKRTTGEVEGGLRVLAVVAH